jgi:hypothetical protein
MNSISKRLVNQDILNCSEKLNQSFIHSLYNIIQILAFFKHLDVDFKCPWNPADSRFPLISHRTKSSQNKNFNSVALEFAQAVYLVPFLTLTYNFYKTCYSKKIAVFWVVAPCSLVDTVLQPRRQQSSYSPPWEPQILHVILNLPALTYTSPVI